MLMVSLTVRGLSGLQLLWMLDELRTEIEAISYVVEAWRKAVE